MILDFAFVNTASGEWYTVGICTRQFATNADKQTVFGIIKFRCKYSTLQYKIQVSYYNKLIKSGKCTLQRNMRLNNYRL